MPMRDSYLFDDVTNHHKSTPKNVAPKKSTLSFLKQYSQSLEVVKTKNMKLELVLN